MTTPILPDKIELKENIKSHSDCMHHYDICEKQKETSQAEANRQLQPYIERINSLCAYRLELLERIIKAEALTADLRQEIERLKLQLQSCQDALKETMQDCAKNFEERNAFESALKKEILEHLACDFGGTK